MRARAGAVIRMNPGAGRLCALGIAAALLAVLSAGALAGPGPYKMTIQFSGYDRTETLTDFPLLVVFSNGMPGTDFDFGQHPFLRDDGYDLRF